MGTLHLETRAICLVEIDHEIYLQQFWSGPDRGKVYQYDLVMNNKTIESRKKKNSKSLDPKFGYTPLGPYDNILWECVELIIGTEYYRSLLVTEDVQKEVKNKGVVLNIMTTGQDC